MTPIISLFGDHWAWVILSLLFMSLELMIPGVFFIWMGLGSIFVGIALAILPDMGLAAQLLVFALAMTASVLIGIRVQGRKVRSDGLVLNAGLDQYIGRRATAQGEFTDATELSGRISLEDTTYEAIANLPLRDGEKVRITGIKEGVFIVVPQGLSQDDSLS